MYINISIIKKNSYTNIGNSIHTGFVGAEIGNLWSDNDAYDARGQNAHEEKMETNRNLIAQRIKENIF